MSDLKTEACRFIETELAFSVACDCEEEYGEVTERCEKCEETARRLEKKFREILERGRREEREACGELLDQQDFLDYCKKLGQEPTADQALAVINVCRFIKRQIRAREEK